mgnify:CR=1 FL=1|tara:strand:+ start:535 stop:1281 length:747 start_codon:yes stop_codon:yes gene_type:complete
MASKFDLNKSDLYDILKAKGITHLYHANTVSTSITFLNQGHLLSRKYVQDNNLFQTPQYTDAKDKKFGIFDDVFLDFIDIHKEWKKHDFYGPFLFAFDIEILRSDLIKTLRITKKNSSNWKDNEPEKDWYYSDLSEFNDNYKKENKRNNIGSMIILKDIDGKLPLRPYLSKMIFDNPNLTVNLKGEKKYLSNLLGAKLYEVVNDNNYIDIKRELRHKHNAFQCQCWWEYNVMHLVRFNNLKRLFHPKP